MYQAVAIAFRQLLKVVHFDDSFTKCPINATEDEATSGAATPIVLQTRLARLGIAFVSIHEYTCALPLPE
jgi:hypothetical protein